MRALRDFNTPKIVTDDVPIFMGLIGDLFPALNVPRKREPEFEAMVKMSVVVSGWFCQHIPCTHRVEGGKMLYVYVWVCVFM